MYSAPESCAARRSAHVRRSSSFASLVVGVREREPERHQRRQVGVREYERGGGPPSGASCDVKCHATEEVEHGGEAMTAA
eukprot:6171994-Pleurochrysis_carterae.AAC.4